MSETVNLKADDIMSAVMRTAIDLSANPKQFKGRLTVKVSLMVDGVEIALAPALAGSQASIEAVIEEKAVERAVALISGAGLGQVLKELEAARLGLRRVLLDVRERTHDPDAHVVR